MLQTTSKEGLLMGVRRNVFFLGVVSFFNDISSEMVKAVMPVFLTTFLGASPAFVGFLDGAAEAIASMLRMISGWFSDRLGRRKNLAVIGYALSLVTRVLLVFAAGAWQVFGLRLVDRVGKGVREAPRDALISESIDDSQASRSFGFQRALDALGGVAGPLLAVLILPALHVEYRSFFMVAAFLGLLAIIAFIFVKDHITAPGLRPQNLFQGVFSLRHFDARFRLYLISIFMFGLGSMPIALLVLRAQSIGCCDEAIPMQYLIYAVASWLCASIAGRIAERIGRRNTLVVGFSVAIVGYLVLAGSQSLYVMGIGMALMGLYSGLTDGVQRAFAHKLLARHHLGAGHGLVQAAIGLSALISGTVGGLVWTVLGSSIALFGGVGFMILGLSIFLLVDYRQRLA